MTPHPATMCDFKKRMLAENLDLFKSIVSEPKYYCTKCGRVANTDKWLCMPAPLRGE